jgi:heptosyltransferase I
MSGPLATPPREIALVRLSALGDVVHALPLATALRRAYPDARLTWVIQPVPYRLIYNHPAVDEFLIFRRRRGFSAWRSITDIARSLRARRYDLVVTPQTAFKAGLVTGLLRAPVKIGFDRARAHELSWLFTTHQIPSRPLAHFQDEYLEFLEYLGIDPYPMEWGIRFTEEELVAQRIFFEEMGGPVCAVVVGTSWPEKNWAAERYARLVDALAVEFGFRCILVGGPAASERRMADRILQLAEIPPVDTLGDDVRRLAYLLAGSSLVISPDTGPLHLARALDVPVVGLYGYTNPIRCGPYEKYQELVVDGYAAHPGEVYPSSQEYRPEGMGRVTVEGVLEKVQLAVERYPRVSEVRP